MGGIGVLSLMEYLMNLILPFPDLTQEAAAVDDENLCVDGDKATLEVEAETNGEMYVSWDDFVQLL